MQGSNDGGELTEATIAQWLFIKALRKDRRLIVFGKQRKDEILAKPHIFAACSLLRKRSIRRRRVNGSVLLQIRLNRSARPTTTEEKCGVWTACRPHSVTPPNPLSLRLRVQSDTTLRLHSPVHHIHTLCFSVCLLYDVFHSHDYCCSYCTCYKSIHPGDLLQLHEISCKDPSSKKLYR